MNEKENPDGDVYKRIQLRGVRSQHQPHMGLSTEKKGARQFHLRKGRRRIEEDQKGRDALLLGEGGKEKSDL